MQDDVKKEEQVEEIQDAEILEQESEVESESSKIEALEAKIEELKSANLRTYADFENTKKRLEKEKSQMLEYANEGILKDLLPIIDSLDRALEAANELSGGEKISEGLQLVLENLNKVLGKHGVEMIDCSGEFDPNLHDAIMQAPNPDKQNDEINQVLQKGFKYKQRTLRPAMVSVVKN